MTYEQLKYLMDKISKYEEVLNEIREQVKKITKDIDLEPWSVYKVRGDKLFDLVQILDKVKDL